MDQQSDENWLKFLDDIIARSNSSSERKQDRSRQREKEILRASMRVFARDGISKSRLSDIAAEAGTPISTIYEYFSGKEEIAHAVPVANMNRFFSQYRKLVAKKSTAYEYLWHFLHLSADFARSNPDWSRSLYLEIWPSVKVEQSEIKDLFDDYARICIYIMEMGEKRGEWPKGQNYYELASVFIGALNQIIVTWALTRKPRDLSRSAAKMITRMMTLLEPVDPPNI